MSTYQRTLPLFYCLQAVIDSSNTLQKYNAIFKALDLKGFPDRRYHRGRAGYSRHAMLRAFIVKHLERIRYVPQLIDYLDANPVLAQMCGFTPALLPDESQFYRFLKESPNSQIQNLLHQAAKKLINEGSTSNEIFVLDSKPILAATKHNNLKNPHRKLKKDSGPPKRNPQATLGYYSYQLLDDGTGSQKKFTCFWGYRTHVIINQDGLPLVEISEPNNRIDAQIAQKLIKKLIRIYGTVKGKIFIADAAYDVKDIYNLIVEQLQAQAFIPINPRNQKQWSEDNFDEYGSPVCPAGLKMKYKGKCIEASRKRLKYRCPIKANRKVAKMFSDKCPIENRHFAGYGCTRYIDVTNDARSQVPRESELFKATFSKRIAVEQYFARFGDRAVEQTSHYKLRSVKNQITIGHLSLVLVAAAAVALGRAEKIRCWRTFAA